MANIVERLQSFLYGDREVSLDEVQRMSPGMTRIPSTEHRPEHLQLHGIIIKRGGQQEQFNMTIHRRSANIEVTSVMGEVPNDSFGAVVTDTVNQAMDGKYVQVGSHKPNMARLALVTQQPGKHFGREELKREQDRHVTAYSEVNPILQRVVQVNNQVVGRGHSEQTRVAKQIVTEELRTQKLLRGHLEKPRYIPQCLEEDVG